jgi:hypothetical protein
LSWRRKANVTLGRTTINDIVDFGAEECEDATVPEQSAIVEDSEIYPVEQARGTPWMD